jgi:hypothetical protein
VGVRIVQRGGLRTGQPDALLADNAEYLGLASTPGERQESWQRFLVADHRRQVMVRGGDWAIGDDEFRQRVLLEHGRLTARRRGRPPKPASAALYFAITDCRPRTNLERHRFPLSWKGSDIDWLLIEDEPLE